MLSTPPPINASLPPLTIWYAASAIDCRPEEQNRLMVTPPVEVGSPASMAETLPMLCPCGPWGCPHPRMTSSTSRGSSWGVLRSTSWMQCAARSSGRVRLNDPRNDLARAVRELATMTASLMSLLSLCHAHSEFPSRRPSRPPSRRPSRRGCLLAVRYPTRPPPVPCRTRQKAESPFIASIAAKTPSATPGLRAFTVGLSMVMTATSLSLLVLTKLFTGLSRKTQIHRCWPRQRNIPKESLPRRLASIHNQHVPSDVRRSVRRQKHRCPFQ